MEQKFVNFDDAIEKLGITAERLHALREAGELRAYRDGKSWKFRTDEIDGMVEGGVPEPSPPSDIGLVSREELVAAAPIDLEDDDDDDLGLMLEEDEDAGAKETAEKAAPTAGEKSDLDLEIDLGDTDAVSESGELQVEGLDDTVTAGSSDIRLAAELSEAGPSDSILISEEEFGESVTVSPSTIIGKDKLGSDDDDLELALEDDDEDIAGESDVQLAPSSGASDVLSAGIAGSGVLDELDDVSGGTSAFKDLEELDLAEESSPALDSSGAAPKAADAAKADAKQESPDDSDFSLDDLKLTDDGSNMGSTDVPMLEIEHAEGGASGSEIDLDTEDDILLSDASGSDLSLDSGDSGINLISPADSGLALDDIPLEMGGSAILSSLSLEGSDPEISLIGGSSEVKGSSAELQTDDDFQLTPLSEASGEEGDSSSQVIALDDDIEDFSEGASAVLDESAFAEEEDGVSLSSDFADAPAGDLDVEYAPSSTVATVETPYTTLNILGLASSALLLLLAGTMMLDMMRNIWSWDESYSLNSSLMEAILGWF